MSLRACFVLMGQYNQWMNGNVYDAAAKLREDTIREDQGAFFKSILGTLNHIMVGDTIWLKRFAEHPRRFGALDYVRDLNDPTSLDQILYDDLDALRKVRQELDEVVVDWIQLIEEKDLNGDLEYTNTKGKRFKRSFGSLIQHFFNHQTHHRGQVSTLLYQNGIDVGSTDLLTLIPAQNED